MAKATLFVRSEKLEKITEFHPGACFESDTLLMTTTDHEILIRKATLTAAKRKS